MKYTVAMLLCFITFYSNAQKTDVKLQQQVSELIQGFHGDIGIYIHDLKNNKIVAINADTIFPTASIVKCLP